MADPQVKSGDTAKQATGSAAAARGIDSSQEKLRNYSAFDAQLTHQALNVQMFIRLLKWTKPYRVTLISAAVLVLVSSAFMLLMPIMQNRVIIDMILAPGSPTANAAMADYGLIDLTEFLMAFLQIPGLAVALILYIALFCVQSLLGIAQQLLLTSGALKTLRDLRVQLFASLEQKPASFYDHVAVGRVMTRVTSDVDNLYNLITSFIQHAGDFVVFFMALFIMLDFAFDLTLVAMLVIPFCALATYLFRMAIKEIVRAIRDSVSSMNQYMQEDLMGIEVVQLSGREEHNFEEFQDRNKENRKQEFRQINFDVLFEMVNMSLPSIATAAIIWYGGGKVVQEEITLGTMIVFTSYLNMMVQPVTALGQLFGTLFRSMASGERIFQALDWEERLHEPEEPYELPERLEGHIEFRNVNFSYLSSEQILKDVSFKIAPGEKLAIVGPTGSGKSTIIRLLARFYDFDDDQIFIDGIDLNRMASHDIRERVGVVLQDFHIFSGTVLDNISLNNPNITRERAIWAANVVNADPFIQALPDGYDTELSERGHNLSQGQQQLLAFARVLAADTEILVLDEATSSIDTGTELIIQDGLHKLTEGRTSIIIAHRLQTIQECDRILVLHHGEVKEIGTHDELIELKGIYYTLHELQFQDSTRAAELTQLTPEERARRRARWVEMNSGSDDPTGGPGMGPGGIGGGSPVRPI
ncbi:MAG: ABC transporter ATP-binding protein [Gammaproteobacteria bacterium]|nr:ABC transporter ATP-binding protein [Gammaproteobacteria bacterium]